MTRALVICDLDETLISINTSFHFGKYLWKLGELSSFRAALLIKYYLRHSLGFDSSFILHQKSFDLLFKGECSQKFNNLAREFAELCKEKALPKVLAFVNKKKQEGAYTCLLSTGPDVIVRHFGLLFGFDEVLSTTYLCGVDKRFSHVGKLIDGTVKSELASHLMKKENFERTYALTDSIRDLELLKIVSDPIAVNPDSRLKKEAKARGFQIL